MPAMNAETKAKISASMTGKKKTPEHKAKISASNKATWSDPKLLAKHSALMAEVCADPEYRVKTSAALTMAWTGAESRAKRSAAQTEARADPEYRARQSAAQTERWADPEYRAMMEEISADPEYRAKLSANLTERWADPEFHAKMVATFVEGPEWLGPYIERGEMVVTLLEQDGGLCQLCLFPLLLDVHYKHLFYTNVDHIRPEGSGGTNDPGNLWLAHAHCNKSKQARWVGREDGTTDRRVA